jgi:hypothetical protein
MFESGVCAWSSTHAIVNLDAELVSTPRFSLPSKGQVILSDRPPHAHPNLLIFTKRA